MCWYARMLTQVYFLSLSAQEDRSGPVQVDSWPHWGELTMATVCSVKKAGGHSKCSRKGQVAFLFWGLNICECLALEAVWFFWNPWVWVLLFLFVLVPNSDTDMFWITFFSLPNYFYTHCFDSELFIFISLTPLSVLGAEWVKECVGVWMGVYFCNFFSFIPPFLSNFRVKICVITDGLSFYYKR